MNRRDKLVLAGAGALLLSLGAAAMLTETGEELPPAPVRPARSPEVATTRKGEVAMTPGTKRLLDRIVSEDEVPSDFKEAENYLEARWGHLGDSGLVAPGVMPEGDMYFQDKRIIRGVRGNGKPVFAKTFLRPQRVNGPTIKAGAYQGLECGPRMEVPELNNDRIERIVNRIARKGTLKDKNKPVKAPTLDELPGSGFRPRGQGASDSVDGSAGGGGGSNGGGAAGVGSGN